MPDYASGKIYKITSGDLTYIGSTCEPTLAKRLAKHVGDYKQWKNGGRGNVTSFQLIDTGNYDITLLELCACGSKDELTARERFYIETNECVNKNIPGRTDKEYREVNKTELAERDKAYREANKDKIAEKNKAYHEANKTEIAEKDKKRYEANKTEKLEKAKTYREANKDKIAEKNKAWKQANKEKIAVKQKAYREANKIKNINI